MLECHVTHSFFIPILLAVRRGATICPLSCFCQYTVHGMAMALHFSGEHPEDQFYTDFGNLNRFDDEVGLNTEFTGSSWKYYCFRLQPFSQLSTVVFHFLVAPQQVSQSQQLSVWFCEYSPTNLATQLSTDPPPLQSSHFLSQLEEFSSQYSLGLNALKNLVKSVLIISYLLLRSNA